MYSLYSERLLASKKKSFSVSDDGDVGLVVRYKGTSASATVEVASTTGDITFKHGALGAEAVDSTIDSGASTGGSSDPGVIDVSDSSNLTMGEVVDLINGSSNWEAYLVDCLRADNANTLLLTLSAAQAHKIPVPSGVRLYKDSSQNDNFDISKAITNRDFPNGFTRSDTNKVNRVFGVSEVLNYASGAVTVRVYEINPVEQSETLVYTRAGGADDVELNLSSTDIDIMSDPGNYLLVRVVNDTIAANGRLTVLGQSI